MKLIGYYPDYDPTIEGVITDCEAFVPSEKGFEAAIAYQLLTSPATSTIGPARSAASLLQPDGSVRTLAGDARTAGSGYYELISGAWSNLGFFAPLTPTAYWSFAQFGEYALFVTPNYPVYASSGTGSAFVSTGSPTAKIVIVVNNFVMIFATNDGTYGDDPTRWWCSAINDHTDWTPSIATQSATGQLTSTAGPIMAALPLGEYAVAYKERAVFLGVYVGSGGGIWSWREIKGDAGCIAQNAVVDIGTPTAPYHLFMGTDNFWIFDGANVMPVGDGVNQTVFDELDPDYAYQVQALHDRRNNRVYFYYPSTSGGGANDRCVVYHYRKQQWGRDDYSTIDIASCFEFRPSAGTLGQDENSIPASIDVDGAIRGLVGTVYRDASFTTGDLGDDENYYLLQRVKPRWITKPTSATMVNYYKDSQGDALTEDATTTMSESRFDVLRSARNHRFKFNTVGQFVLNEINYTYDVDGEE